MYFLVFKVLLLYIFLKVDTRKLFDSIIELYDIGKEKLLDSLGRLSSSDFVQFQLTR